MKKVNQTIGKEMVPRAHPEISREISAFCRLVYTETARIPKGEVRTYGEIARSIGYPRAARAVGSCLKRNFDPAIPCHRVIKSNGTVGSYNRGGEDKKRSILTQEGWCG